MPYTLRKHPNGSYSVQSPNGTKAASTTKSKAMKQMALLRALEHGTRKR